MLESYERECPNHSTTIINIDFPALCSRDSLDDNDFDNFMFHLCAPGDSCSVRESVSSSFCYKKIHSQSFLPVLCTFFVVHFSSADDGGQNEPARIKAKVILSLQSSGMMSKNSNCLKYTRAHCCECAIYN